MRALTTFQMCDVILGALGAMLAHRHSGEVYQISTMGGVA
jgi:hypothetical protein